MATNYTTAMLKDRNKKSILQFLYTQKKTTPHMIAKKLNLSRPTVAQTLKELMLEEQISISGLAESTGGRKANLYVFNSSKKIAIGLEILIDQYEIVAIDLYADVIKYEKIPYKFDNIDSYYEKVSDSVNQFISNLNIPPENVLGVGIALQALISSDGKSIVYGKILNCTGLNIKQFSDRIPYKCVFNHDAESLANSELWFDSSLKNAIFFNIRDNLSGAVIINGDFLRGGELKNGLFEHMTIVPGGRPCYCGKKGCVNSYCSISAFLKPEEDINSFFNSLRSGDTTYKARWDDYLENLAMVIDNLHMFITSDVILGGTLSRYLIPQDINKLQRMAHKHSAFPSKEQYIKISRFASTPLCLGAALPLIKHYQKKVMR